MSWFPICTYTVACILLFHRALATITILIPMLRWTTIIVMLLVPIVTASVTPKLTDFSIMSWFPICTYSFACILLFHRALATITILIPMLRWTAIVIMLLVPIVTACVTPKLTDTSIMSWIPI